MAMTIRIYIEQFPNGIWSAWCGCYSGEGKSKETAASIAFDGWARRTSRLIYKGREEDGSVLILPWKFDPDAEPSAPHYVAEDTRDLARELLKQLRTRSFDVIAIAGHWTRVTKAYVEAYEHLRSDIESKDILIRRLKETKTMSARKYCAWMFVEGERHWFVRDSHAGLPVVWTRHKPNARAMDLDEAVLLAKRIDCQVEEIEL